MMRIDSRWNNQRLAALGLILALLIAADQITKYLVRSNLTYGTSWPDNWELIRISYIQNTGVAFGFLQGQGELLSFIVPIVLLGFVYMILTQPPLNSLSDYSFVLIVAGAVGNLIDRFWHGAVTDFIDPAYYPAFNVADSLISIGAVVLIGTSLLDQRKRTLVGKG
jgi:signal peptidase II